MTRGGALRAISCLAAPLLQSCTKVHSFAYSPQNTTLPRTASADGNVAFLYVYDHVSADGNVAFLYVYDHVSQYPPMVTGRFRIVVCMIPRMPVAKYAITSHCIRRW